jgi:hypothetical protein
MIRGPYSADDPKAKDKSLDLTYNELRELFTKQAVTIGCKGNNVRRIIHDPKPTTAIQSQLRSVPNSAGGSFVS